MRWSLEARLSESVLVAVVVDMAVDLVLKVVIDLKDLLLLLLG